MKTSIFKKSLAILITLALTLGLFSAIPTISAEGNGYWSETTVNSSANSTVNASNWDVIEGDSDITVNYTSSKNSSTGVYTNKSQALDYPVLVFGDSYVRLAMRMAKKDGVEQSDTTQSWVGSIVIGKVSPKLPDGARIKTVSFDVETKAEQAHRSLQIYYDYTDAQNYKAIGLYNFAGNVTSTQTMRVQYGMNYTYDSKVPGDTDYGTAGGSRKDIATLAAADYRNTSSHYKNSKITYTYADDGTVTATFYTELWKATNTDSTLVKQGSVEISLGTITSPKVILSGGSLRSANATNTYGDYTNISYSYESWVDLDAMAAEFKASNPLPNITAMTYDTAIADGRQANAVIEAIAAVTDTNLKEVLADYEQEAEIVVAKANTFITKKYVDDFSSEAYTAANVTSKSMYHSPGTTPTSYADTTYAYENGVMKITQSTDTKTTGMNVNMISSPGNDTVKMVTGKFAIAGGVFRLYFGNKNDETDNNVIQISYGSSESKLTSVDLRILYGSNGGKNWAMRNSATATNTILYDLGSAVTNFNVSAPDVSDPSTYLTFKYIVNSKNRNNAAIFIYAPGREEPIAGLTGNASDKFYQFNNKTDFGLSAISSTSGIYVDSVEISYAESDTFTTVTADDETSYYDLVKTSSFTAPEMQGASIVETDEFDKQDLRYEMTYDTTATITSGYTPYEYGVMLMTNSRMPVNGLLEMTSVGELGLDVIIASAKVEEGGTVPATFYAEIGGTASLGQDGTFNASLVGKRFVARPYVAYKNDTTGELIYAYGGNEVDSTEVENGQASKSVISVAKSIANAEIAKAAEAGQNIDENGEIAAIIAKTSTTTNDERMSLLTFICENRAYLG